MLPFSREIGAQFLLGRFARNTRISLGTRGTGIPSLESPADPLSNVKSVFSYSLPYTPDFVAFYFAIDLDKLVRGFEAAKLHGRLEFPIRNSRASPRISYRTVEGLEFDEALEGLASNFLPNSRGPRIRLSTRGPRLEFLTEQSRGLEQSPSTRGQAHRLPEVKSCFSSLLGVICLIFQPPC